MKLEVNKENPQMVEHIRNKLRETGNHCPCVPKYLHSDDNLCPCKEFRDARVLGYCHCQLWRKTEL